MNLNIINWNLSEVMKIDSKTRKLITSNKMHHPKPDVDYLYLPRSSGGIGMTQLELSFKTCSFKMSEY